MIPFLVISIADHRGVLLEYLRITTQSLPDAPLWAMRVVADLAQAPERAAVACLFTTLMKRQVRTTWLLYHGATKHGYRWDALITACDTSALETEPHRLTLILKLLRAEA